MPSASWYLPAAHLMQCTSGLSAPSSVLAPKRPFAQALHSDKPFTSAYRPAAQWTQDSSLSEPWVRTKRPTGQSLHACVPTISANDPVAQVWQTVATAPPVLAVKRPSGQGVQLCDPALFWKWPFGQGPQDRCPVAAWKWPALHSAHAAALMLAIAALYRPCVHAMHTVASALP